MKSLLIKFVIIGLIIFCNIEVGRAEGAWVLWSKKQATPSNENIKEVWELERAFPSYNECVAYKGVLINQLKEVFASITTKDTKESMELVPSSPDSIILLVKKPNFYFLMTKYECFPDTVDPRK